MFTHSTAHIAAPFTVLLPQKRMAAYARFPERPNVVAHSPLVVLWIAVTAGRVALQDHVWQFGVFLRFFRPPVALLSCCFTSYTRSLIHLE